MHVFDLSNTYILSDLLLVYVLPFRVTVAVYVLVPAVVTVAFFVTLLVMVAVATLVCFLSFLQVNLAVALVYPVHVHTGVP